MALLAALITASVYAQDSSINPQVLRVYNVTSTTAAVEGLCTLAGGIGVDYGVCLADFEYGVTLPFTQTTKGIFPYPSTSGRTTGTLTDLPPGRIVFVRAVVYDNGVPIYSPMLSFQTAKSDEPTAGVYVTLWDNDCIQTKLCVNAFWSVTGTPSPSIFMVEAKANYSPELSEYVLVGTTDSCNNCRIPVEKGKNYRFVVVGKRTAQTPSLPDGPALAQYTYNAR